MGYKYNVGVVVINDSSKSVGKTSRSLVRLDVTVTVRSLYRYPLILSVYMTLKLTNGWSAMKDRKEMRGSLQHSRLSRACSN